MNWRDQRGASAPMLLVSFWLLVGFLGICCDSALYYVYREQFRTALEAGATAGAQMVGYRMAVRLEREKYAVVTKSKACPPDAAGNPAPAGCVITWNEWAGPSPATAVDLPEGWEQDLWTPVKWGVLAGGVQMSPKRLYDWFSGYCQQAPNGDPPISGASRVVCTDIVVRNCRVAPKPPDAPAAPLEQARRIYEANRSRWALSMRDAPVWEQEISGGTLRVKASGNAEIPTIFLKAFGIPSFPIDGRGADGGPIVGEWVRVAKPPPGCPAP